LLAQRVELRHRARSDICKLLETKFVFCFERPYGRRRMKPINSIHLGWAQVCAITLQTALHLRDRLAAITRLQPIFIVETGLQLRVPGIIGTVKLLPPGCVDMDTAERPLIAAAALLHDMSEFMGKQKPPRCG
jgi:hypothetical protein